MRKYLSHRVLVLSAVIFGLAVLTWSAAYAAETGCVKCHTNDKMLKALHKPVKVEASEGVG